MLRRLFITTIISVVNFHIAVASSNDTLIVGTWKGTSICQIKNSPCHDEIAVYHISKGDKPGTYRFVMNKVVNGAEEDMGIIEYTYDAVANTLTSLDEARKIVWKFKVNGKTMEGTLVYKNELYRIIKLSREK
jgi:hypothetical protein